IDPQGVVEAFLTFPADHGSQMKNGHGWVGANGGKNGRAVADVARHLSNPRVRRRAMEEGIEQDDFIDGFGRQGGTDEGAAFQKLPAKLGTEEAASACNDDLHALEGSGFAM
ncbi:MAG: hypothetical protein JWM16_5237, partial [Verrucomicrobiales bacterium]|nr:hypothetical protein [Verrucomicrobiales bacterium]